MSFSINYIEMLRVLSKRSNDFSSILNKDRPNNHLWHNKATMAAVYVNEIPNFKFTIVNKDFVTYKMF